MTVATLSEELTSVPKFHIGMRYSSATNYLTSISGTLVLLKTRKQAKLNYPDRNANESD